MAIATLQAIITKVRKLTVSGKSNQLTDSDIIDYLNSFYLYDFPAQFRSLDLKDIYTFNTTMGIDTYPFDRNHWINLQMPAWVAKRSVQVFFDPQSFYYFNYYSSNHNQQFQQLSIGNGSQVSFTGTLQNVPILRSINNNPAVQTPLSNTNVFPSGFPVTFPQANIDRIQNFLLTANVRNGMTLNVTDDGNGNLIGDVDTSGTNTINYATGAISVKFSQAPGNQESITAQYNPLVLNMPIALLYYQDQIICRPVPDQGYTVEITAYRTPSQALLGTNDPNTPNMSGVPELMEWWETLAIGTAKKVYEDRIDMEGVAMMDKMLEERYQLNYTRTYANLGKRRIQTLFSDQLDYTNNYMQGSGGGN